MQTIKNLANADKDKKSGNHRVSHVPNGRDFYYFSTIICGVDDVRNVFYIDSSYGSVSTTRACNAYRAYFKMEGYTEINLVTGQAI